MMTSPTALVAARLSEYLQKTPRARYFVDGISPVAAALAPEAHGQQVLFPVGERAMTAVGLGRAWAGEPVVVEVSSLERLSALTEVLSDGASASGEFAPQLTLLVGGALPGGEEMGERALGQLLSLSAVEVFTPADGEALAAALTKALGSRQISVVCIPTHFTDAASTPEAPEVLVAAIGEGMREAKEACESLWKQGVAAKALALHELSSAQTGRLAEEIEAVGRIVFLCHAPDGAVAQYLVSSMLQSGFLSLEAPPVAVVPAHGVRGALHSLEY